MNIVIPDDYQDVVRQLSAFDRLSGHQVTLFNDTLTSLDAQVERFHHAEALVLIRERTRITRALLERLPKLRVISQTGGGVAHIDLEACREHGVTVLAGRGSPTAAAELTWALVLAAMRHIPEEVANLKAGRWAAYAGHRPGRQNPRYPGLRQDRCPCRSLRPSLRHESAGMGARRLP